MKSPRQWQQLTASFWLQKIPSFRSTIASPSVNWCLLKSTRPFYIVARSYRIAIMCQSFNFTNFSVLLRKWWNEWMDYIATFLSDIHCYVILVDRPSAYRWSSANMNLLRRRKSIQRRRQSGPEFRRFEWKTELCDCVPRNIMTMRYESKQ